MDSISIGHFGASGMEFGAMESCLVDFVSITRFDMPGMEAGVESRTAKNWPGIHGGVTSGNVNGL